MKIYEVSYYQNVTVEKWNIKTSFALETILELGEFEEFTFAKATQNIGVKDINIGGQPQLGIPKEVFLPLNWYSKEIYPP